MIIQFGWNKKIIKNLGEVKDQQCGNCHQTAIGQLNTVTSYITVYMIPILPTDIKYLYFCPICKHGIILEASKINTYKKIARINTEFKRNKISETEKTQKLTQVYNSEKIEEEKILKEFNKWEELVANLPTEELKIIINSKKGSHNLLFINAAEIELTNRSFES